MTKGERRMAQGAQMLEAGMLGGYEARMFERIDKYKAQGAGRKGNWLIMIIKYHSLKFVVIRLVGKTFTHSIF